MNCLLKVLFLALGAPCLSWASLANILEPVTFQIPQETLATPKAVAPSVFGANTPAPSPIEEPKKTLIQEVDVIEAIGRVFGLQYMPKGSLNLRFEQPWKPVYVNSDDWAIEVMDNNNSPLVTRMWVKFCILCEGQRVGSWRIPLCCELFEEVFYVRQRINRGAPLEMDFLEERVCNVLALKQEPVRLDAPIELYQASQTLQPGQPLLWKEVVRRPVIQKGKFVSVTAREGAMRIHMKGEALSSGIVGEFIQVRNLTSHKEFAARVVDPHTVEVVF